MGRFRSTAGQAEPGPQTLLEVRDLEVSYGEVSALRGVSLGVREGQIVAVLGNNGAGKSTLLRAISGTLALERGTIERGSVSLQGRSLGGLEPAVVVRAGVVQVPEGRRIFGDLTVEENLRAGAFGRRDGRNGRDAAYQRVVELFPRLHERRAQRGSLLSGGEQQMLAIGRALMSDPKVLLLDEPSLGLAPQLVDRIGEIVRQINEQGTAVVLVEQNAAMALAVADHAFVLEVGKVSVEGPAERLLASDEVRERYLGIAAGDTHRIEAEPIQRVTTGERHPKPLRVDGVTMRFGGLVALDDVTLEVEPGSAHAIIGPNGAGKSTLLNVLTGVYKATSGRVDYGGSALTELRPAQIATLGVSRTFQNLALSPTASVRENLLLGRHRMSKAGFVSAGLRLPRARRELAEQERIVDGMARLWGLSEFLDLPMRVLPYGVRKRAELARALCAEPSLLLLDEPVAGMNLDESREMARSIVQAREALGISVVLVEHNMPFVMGLADRVTVLDFGRVIAEGTPQDVQHDPEVLRAYLGFAAATHEAEVASE